MTPWLMQMLRSRGLAVCVHAGLWLLLYLAAVSYGGKAPAFRDSEAFSSPAQSPVPVSKLERLFAADAWPRDLVGTNLANPFFTRHFIPAPTPAPTTRKVEITYLGFYQTDGAAKQVVVKLADAFVVKPIGANVTTNWLLAEATLQALSLTNRTGQSTLLPLDTKKEIEVPIP